MVVVDSHHRVLAAWAAYRSKLAHAPRLLTLDHHTDTSAPFRNRLKGRADFDREQAEWLAAIDFSQPSTVEEAIERLSHDEHITTAIRTGIISSALVIAHNAMDTDAATYEKHRIICYAVARAPNAKSATRQECDKALDSDFLKSALESFDRVLTNASETRLRDAPYILDIDLDYLNTRKSIAPESPALLRSLAQGAGLITIATEPEHVQYCSLDQELTSGYLLQKMIDLID